MMDWEYFEEVGTVLHFADGGYANCHDNGVYIIDSDANCVFDRDLRGISLDEMKAVAMMAARRLGFLPRHKRTKISPKLRFSILRRDRFRCHYCGADPTKDSLEVDHLLAVAQGGKNNPENLVTACETCNQGKSSSSIERGLN